MTDVGLYHENERSPVSGPNSVEAGGGNIIAQWDRGDLAATGPVLLTLHKTSQAMGGNATNATFYLHGVMPDDYNGEALELDLWVRCNTTDNTDTTVFSLTMECMAHGEDDSGDSFNATADTGTVTYTTTAYTLRKLTVALANCVSEEAPAADDEFRIKGTITTHDPGTSLPALITMARLRKVP